MFALVEVFDEAELDSCVPVIGEYPVQDTDGRVRILLGVNCRDLRSLEIEFARFESIVPHLPTSFPWVAESGIVGAGQAREVAALGYRLALVGTALMRAADPANAAREFLSAGRDAAMTA